MRPNDPAEPFQMFNLAERLNQAIEAGADPAVVAAIARDLTAWDRKPDVDAGEILADEIEQWLFERDEFIDLITGLADIARAALEYGEPEHAQTVEAVIRRFRANELAYLHVPEFDPFPNWPTDKGDE